MILFDVIWSLSVCKCTDTLNDRLEDTLLAEYETLGESHMGQAKYAVGNRISVKNVIHAVAPKKGDTSKLIVC